jgi:hypothetical protein
MNQVLSTTNRPAECFGCEKVFGVWDVEAPVGTVTQFACAAGVLGEANATLESNDSPASTNDVQRRLDGAVLRDARGAVNTIQESAVLGLCHAQVEETGLPVSVELPTKTHMVALLGKTGSRTALDVLGASEALTEIASSATMQS